MDTPGWSRKWYEGVRLDPGLGENLASQGIQAEGLPEAQLWSRAGDGAPLVGVSAHHPLLIPTPPPAPGGLPGGGDRLSDEAHYALNPPD